MVAILSRGVSRIVAALSGLLLVFGIVYAMEGMTTRMPTTSVRELLVSTGLMLPWVLLFCSGFDDLTLIIKRHWIFWIGPVLVLGFVYYFDRNTSLQNFNTAVMPVLACVLAIQPHIFRRIVWLYSVVSVLFGLCGVLVLLYVAQIYFRGGSFTNRPTAAYVFSFAVSSVIAAALSIRRQTRDSRAAMV